FQADIKDCLYEDWFLLLVPEGVVVLAWIVGSRVNRTFLGRVQFPERQQDIRFAGFVCADESCHVINFNPAAVFHRAKICHTELSEFGNHSAYLGSGRCSLRAAKTTEDFSGASCNYTPALMRMEAPKRNTVVYKRCDHALCDPRFPYLNWEHECHPEMESTWEQLGSKTPRLHLL